MTNSRMLRKLIQKLIIEAFTQQDVEEAIDYVISNFELAEVDIIQETLANHIADWIEKTNRQWEH